MFKYDMLKNDIISTLQADWVPMVSSWYWGYHGREWYVPCDDRSLERIMIKMKHPLDVTVCPLDKGYLWRMGPDFDYQWLGNCYNMKNLLYIHHVWQT